MYRGWGMFGKRITLFELFGFEVRLDLSWIFIAILIAWSLGGSYFPYRYRGFSPATYWIMGGCGAIGLFFSIVAHEFCHSLVARHYGMSMRGITLFIFGGVAEMEDEPPSPKVEFLMSLVGPVSSVVIGFCCYGFFILGMRYGWPMPVNAVAKYLAGINILLACFNLVPALPLDGGRILRSILWKVKKDLRWATRISSGIGSGFGILLIAFAVYNIFMGNFIGGMWWFLIGMFIRGAAQMSYQQLLLRRALEGEPVSRFMKRDPVTVSPSLTVQQLVEEYIYTYHFKMFPVVEAERLLGCVTTKEVKLLPQGEWGRTTVGELAVQCSPENTVEKEADAMNALSLMRRAGTSRLVVVEGGKLVGIVSLKDMLKLLSLKIDLEE